MEIMFLLALIIGIGWYLLNKADQDIEQVTKDYPDADYYRDGWVKGERHD